MTTLITSNVKVHAGTKYNPNNLRCIQGVELKICNKFCRSCNSIYLLVTNLEVAVYRNL